MRRAHPTDRRTTLASITPRGRKIAAAATEALNASRFGTAPMSDGELESLTHMLEGFRRTAGDFREE